MQPVSASHFEHFMTDPDPNAFTEREKFILSYYRDTQLSDPKRHLGYDLALAIVSVGCVVIAITHDEFVFGLIGYGILLWRLFQTTVTGSRWTRDF